MKSSNMNRVKVIKEFYDVPVGTELVYNDKKNVYEYMITDRETNGIINTYNHIVIELSPDIIELNSGEYFEYIYDKLIDYTNLYKYIKPLVYKGLIGSNSVKLQDVKGNTIDVNRKLFDMLFKVIE
jgi:hypothetical protein